MKIFAPFRRIFRPEPAPTPGMRLEGKAEPSDVSPKHSNIVEGGEWVEDWRKGKLRIRATFPSAETTRVAVRVAGEIVREVSARPVSDGKWAFSFAFGKSSLAHFPNRAQLALEIDGAVIPHASGPHAVTVEVPRGDGTLHQRLRDGHMIDKWGQLKLPIALKPEWARAVLSLYERFSDYFDERFGKRPFFIAGSLLGFARENDFLPFDDDMDIGYFSMRSTPEAVRDEMFEMLKSMLDDGWNVRVGHNGGFYKVTGEDADFDVFPSWSYDSRIWLPQSQSMPAKPDLMHPPAAAEFRGARIYVPNRVEEYLTHHYGPNWRVPDPHYLETKKPGVLKVLKRARLTEAQRNALKAMQQR